MSTQTSDVPTEAQDATHLQDGDADEPAQDATSTGEWYTSFAGIGIVGFDVSLMLGIAASTTSLGDHLVPLEVYMFGALGALGYVFRSLLHGFDQSVTDVLRTNVQVLAAIPLSAGIYLFADMAQSGEPGLEFIAAIAFVSGLFVDLAYETLSKIANRVLSQGLAGNRTGRKTGSNSGTNRQPDRPDESKK